MTTGDASRVLHAIAAAYPLRWRNAPPSELQLWIEMLESLDAFDVAFAAAAGFIRESPEPPSIAEFRSAYNGRLRRERDSDDSRAIEQQTGGREPHTPEEWRRKAVEHAERCARDYPGKPPLYPDETPPSSRREFHLMWDAWLNARLREWSAEAKAERGRRTAAARRARLDVEIGRLDPADGLR